MTTAPILSHTDVVKGCMNSKKLERAFSGVRMATLMVRVFIGTVKSTTSALSELKLNGARIKSAL